MSYLERIQKEYVGIVGMGDNFDEAENDLANTFFYRQLDFKLRS